MAYQPKNHRKFLATSLTAAMVATAVAPAASSAAGFSDVAEGSFYFEFVTALNKAGIIDGRNDGTFDLGGHVTRAEAAKMISKILKLDETKAPSAGFSDVKAGAWYEGYVNAVAAAKIVNGFDGKFDPNGKLTREAFAKIVVEAYKLKVDATVALPFSDVAEGKWYTDYIKTLYKNELISGTSATSFGLGENVKRADFAKLLVETDYKVGSTLKPAAPVAVEVSSVNALTNNKVKVSFKAALTVAPKAEAFAIKAEDGTAVAVSNVVLAADGKSAVLTTAEVTPYALYTLKSGEATFNFVGLAKDTTKPSADTVAVETFQTVKVTFNEAVDASTATNIANYTIDNNLSVLKAELSADGKVVTLTTASQVVGTIYKVTVQNVTDVAGNAMDKKEAYFGGMAKDTSAQAVNTVAVTDYNQVTVTFNKAVDSDSATNIANYVLDNGLSVLKAEVSAADTTGKTVVLTTGDQKVGTIYKITVNNVKDKIGNNMEKAVENYFGGMAKNTSKPTATVSVTDNNKVTVAFNLKVDSADATNVANYTFDNNLTVVKAELGTDGKTVTLTTSPQTVGTIYKTTVQNVKTIYGTAMDKTEQYFGGMAKDVTGPAISTVTASANKLTIVFDQNVDAATATSLANYKFDGGLGYATSAKVLTDGKTVELTTANQTPGKVYSVTVSNVQDKNGNAINTANNASKKSFVGQGTAAATAALKFQAASVVNNNTIDLIFDRELTQTEANAVSASVTGVTTSAAYVELQENKKVVRVQYRTTASGNPDLFTSGTVYNVVVTGPALLETPVAANNNNTKAFAGTNVTNAAPEILAVSTIDSTTIKVTFSEPVKGINNSAFTFEGYTGTISATSVADANTVVKEATLYLSTPTTQGEVYKIVPTASIDDAAGYNDIKLTSGSTTLKYQFAGTNVENAAPSIQTVVATDKFNFDIVFSEAVTKTSAEAASFTLKQGTTTVGTVSGKLSADGTKLSVALTSPTALESGKIYTVETSSTITDLAGKNMAYPSGSTVVSKQFAGTDAANAAPEIAGVSIDSTRKVLTVTFSEKLSNTSLSAADFTITATGYTAGADTYVLGSDGKTVTITLANALNANQIASVAAKATVLDVNNQAAKTTAYQFGIQ
jgi:trimeric autotransporter adhesin